MGMDEYGINPCLSWFVRVLTFCGPSKNLKHASWLPERLRVIENGWFRPEPVGMFPDWKAFHETGLIGLTLYPNFPDNHFLCVSLE